VGVFYALSSWALAVAVGPDRVAAEAGDQAEQLPMGILEAQYGAPVVAVASLLLLSSIFAAMLSFHNGVARYVFGMAREDVLPRNLARIGSGASGGAPTAGSLLQTGLGAAVIVLAVGLGVDPLTMFYWLAALAALGVLVLLLVTSVAAWQFFQRGGGAAEGVGARRVAPVIGGVLGLAVLVVTVLNLDKLLGVSPDSLLPWVLPGVVAAAGAGGLAWGLALRNRDPARYAGIGHGQPDPLATPEQRLAELEI